MTLCAECGEPTVCFCPACMSIDDVATMQRTLMSLRARKESATKPPRPVQPLLPCPRCGVTIEWSEWTAKDGAVGDGWCLRALSRSSRPDDDGSGCTWRGHVRRIEDGTVRIVEEDRV